ncbi:MAG: hypothetical protein RBS85_00445 [Methanofastidiosum sp.]|jgi:hypothetical protein|nr:hypothetical protein [Methanofastidiosum sp.]
MKPSDKLFCKTFPCKNIEKSPYQVPYLQTNPDKIKIIMISEVSPLDPKDYFYSSGNPPYMETTKEAFSEAGHPVNSIQDILNLGIYLTTAVKCAKIETSISTDTI